MEGLYMYWFGWLAWVACTFFMPRTEWRAVLSLFILALLVFVPLTISVAGIAVSLGFVLSLLICYMHLGKRSWKQLLYPFFCTACVTITFVTMKELIRIDPVILVIDQRILLTLSVLVVSFLFVRGNKRTVLLALGLLHGEIVLHAYRSESAGSSIGSYAFFDVLALSVFVSVSFTLLQMLVKKWEKHVLAGRAKPAAIPNRIDKHA